MMSRLNGLAQFSFKVKLFRKENLCEGERWSFNQVNQSARLI
jgi:hypothetical protein